MSGFTEAFTKFSSATARITGRPWVFAICCFMVIVWAVSGPMFGFSDTWQLVINTSTTIITFLMVFLIQNTQNRDNNALHAKLDELIRVGKAHNAFIGIENLADKDLEAILKRLDEQSEDIREISGAIPDRRPAAAKRKAATKRPTRQRARKTA
jgi:low affinity Fe/Cu permease